MQSREADPMTDHKIHILNDHERRILTWGITLSICLILIAAAVSY
jgi:hypothetical protein